MLVKCMGNKASDLPVQDVDIYGSSKIEFPVDIGVTYTVYAMQLIEGRLEILLKDNSEKPEWFPMSIFKVIDSRIPSHWEFSSSVDPSGDVEENRKEIGKKWGFRPVDAARWGYPKIVHSDEHYLGLIDREFNDMMFFYQEQQSHEESGAHEEDF